jgi:3-oxoacyl-[acyl-carrier protein] reductase
VLLEGKTAIVYGAGGTIGGEVARAFAREGATVFLAGRNAESLDGVAQAITAEGGTARTAAVDALDEDSVDRHAEAVAAEAGGIDVSFNGISHGDVHGQSLLEMPFEDFARPVTTALRAQYLTIRAAARHMVSRGSGVIIAITATTGRLVVPNVGGTGVTFDALESLLRQWARELGSRGVRVTWLQTTGIAEALADTGELHPDYGTGKRMTKEEHIAWMTGGTMLGRLTSLADVGNVAAFLASDRAGAMTASGVNLTAGTISTR